MSDLVAIDGGAMRGPLHLACDAVIVGSGPAGATVASHLAAHGIRVVIVEEGKLAPKSFPASGLAAMAQMYRGMGTTMAMGNVPMPYLQGRVVGGTSVINGAICWDFPQAVHTRWLAEDGALQDYLPWSAIQEAQADINRILRVAPTSGAVAGEKNCVLARGADALGLAHRPIRRNTVDCRGSGRCLQGCPTGAKLSMDRSLLPQAVQHGARLVAGACVTHVLHDARGAYGVQGTLQSGARFEVRARTVVLAASAIQTPTLLWNSGVRQGPLGRELSGHPGISLTARFAHAVRNEEGATQGHEVTGTMQEGFKIESLGFGRSILATRIPGGGREWARNLENLDRYAVCGAAIRAQARGRVLATPAGPQVIYSLTADDLRKTQRAVRRMGEIMLAAGAEEVYPGLAGFDSVVRDSRRLAALEEHSLPAASYTMSMTHLFGTARMGTRANSAVVRGDFRHHHVPHLYIADSSVFPSNLGVNPQVAIMALAKLCAERVCKEL